MRDAPRIRLQIALALAALVLAPVGAAAEGQERKPRPGPFVINTQGEALRASLMACPAHKHGAPRQAYEKLRAIVQKLPATQMRTMSMCRVAQLATLRRFAPLVDEIFLNPFWFPSKVKPRKDELLWPGLDHPLINYLRLIRANGHGRRLFARIILHGQPNLFPDRPASFEEVRWMAYAAIGANFQGLSWQGKLADVPWAGRLDHMARGLLSHADDLGTVRPVGWVEPPEGQPVSALASDKKLFCVFLNPEYLSIADKGKAVKLPLDPPPRRGRLTISPPAGVSVRSGTTLSGRPLQLAKADGGVRTDYHFTGSGDILVFDLSGKPRENPTPTTSVTTKPSKESNP